MGKHTAISWTDATWNPWRGCHKVSDGCKNCYMYREQTHYGHDPSTVVRASPQTFNAPIHWREPMMVFTCSWSDFFIEEADPWRGEAWTIIHETPWLTYLILTKRPQNIKARLPADWGKGWPNVWLGVTVESNAYMGRLEVLANIPSYLRFVSYEPALGPVTFSAFFPWFDWVISGGESGPRKADPDWFRAVRDECRLYGTAYFHKQNGGTSKIDGALGGKLLDGVEYHEFPEVRK